MQEYPKHYCGVFGIYGHPNAAELTYYGLYALQHRGQESAGITASDGVDLRTYKGMASSVRCSTRMHSARFPVISPSATSVTRPPAAPTFATRNRSSSIAPGARSPSATTATSPTPPGCELNSKPKARSSRPPSTAKSSYSCWQNP